MSLLAGLARSLSFAVIAFALILSAAAWGAHSVAHGTAPAPVETGDTPLDETVELAAAHDDGAHDRDGQDGGHDHLLGLSFPVAALFGGTPLAPPPPAAAASPPIEVASLELRAADPPPADPPRAA